MSNTTKYGDNEAVQRRLEKRHAELQRIKEARRRWWRKLTRAVTAIDKLNAEERRLLKPPTPPEARNDSGESDELKHRWHKIRELKLLEDLDDPIADL